MHFNLQQQALSIYQQVTFPAFYLLASVIPTGSPLSVVLADWLSMTPALGVASRPDWLRTCSRNFVFNVSQVPSSKRSPSKETCQRILNDVQS
jgi:hypothetical protein